MEIEANDWGSPPVGFEEEEDWIVGGICVSEVQSEDAVGHRSKFQAVHQGDFPTRHALVLRIWKGMEFAAVDQPDLAGLATGKLEGDHYV